MPPLSESPVSPMKSPVSENRSHRLRHNKYSTLVLLRRNDVGTAKKAELQLIYRSFIGEISLNLRLWKFDMLINYHPMGRLTLCCITFCWR
uniref:Uncharacterized protein n=1 Tax=Oryza nivara TaxID=4536 RepID=A0A0E0GB46_ORYNI